MIIELPDLETFTRLPRPRPSLLPCVPGLYAFLGAGDELLHIGSGWSLRDSVEKFTIPDRKLMSEKVTTIAYWEAPSDMSGSALIGFCQILIGSYFPRWQEICVRNNERKKRRSSESLAVTELPSWVEPVKTPA